MTDTRTPDLLPAHGEPVASAAFDANGRISAVGWLVGNIPIKSHVHAGWHLEFAYHVPPGHAIVPATRLTELAEEVERLQDEERLSDEVRASMSATLTAVANALKGTPEPMRQHGWSDLPQIAAMMVQLVQNPRKHKFYAAGEPDCPPDLKAGNGEIHTLRCRLCGLTSPRSPACASGLPPASSHELATLRTTLAAVTAQRDALRKDAERYRWLRERGFGFSHDEQGRGIATSHWGNWLYDTDEGAAAERDAAIDAAMTKEDKP